MSDGRTPIYTTPEQVRADLAYLSGALDTRGQTRNVQGEFPQVVMDDDQLAPLIARAELYVDQVIGGPFPAGGPRKLDPDDLTDTQRAALERATAAQVAFLVRQGEDRLVGADDLIDERSTPSSPPAPRFVNRPYARVSPQVAEILAGHQLIQRTLTAAASPTSNDAAA